MYDESQYVYNKQKTPWEASYSFSLVTLFRILKRSRRTRSQTLARLSSQLVNKNRARAFLKWYVFDPNTYIGQAGIQACRENWELCETLSLTVTGEWKFLHYISSKGRGRTREKLDFIFQDFDSTDPIRFISFSTWGLWTQALPAISCSGSHGYCNEVAFVLFFAGIQVQARSVTAESSRWGSARFYTWFVQIIFFTIGRLLSQFLLNFSVLLA